MRLEDADFVITWKEQEYLVVLRVTGWRFKITGINFKWKEPVLVYRSVEQGKYGPTYMIKVKTVFWKAVFKAWSQNAADDGW